MFHIYVYILFFIYKLIYIFTYIYNYSYSDSRLKYTGIVVFDHRLYFYINTYSAFYQLLNFALYFCEYKNVQTLSLLHKWTLIGNQLYVLSCCGFILPSEPISLYLKSYIHCGQLFSLAVSFKFGIFICWKIC